MPLGLKKRVWVLSAKWAQHSIDCTVSGIVTKCHGPCCRRPYWPASGTDGDDCKYLGGRGCTLPWEDRPVTCLLYPFTVRNNKVVLHGRALIAPCKPCKGTGPPIIESLRKSFTILFGEVIYANMVRYTKEGRDTHFKVPDWVWERHEKEQAWKEGDDVYTRG
jgi:hypothetical protein